MLVGHSLYYTDLLHAFQVNLLYLCFQVVVFDLLFLFLFKEVLLLALLLQNLFFDNGQLSFKHNVIL